ncbi:MAG: PadR family transcriptional regulator [Candidatus Heimdallarchaeaceae archaeon]|uniref:PadR family transcriptional regulator n=1 Tax=Candidatus Heimdallarchaeum endolithica TaxID=2876572 RepID=A0A9Y1BSP7_9ARCH|nr:MAG: PadR family transcriptional regulator [Candidatus Heimdallarchaeum endolithica]
MKEKYTEKDENNSLLSKFKTIESLPITRTLILICLQKQPNSSGYSLIKSIRNLTNDLVKLKSGTLYPELRKLENEGLVISVLTEDKRKTRLYQITDEGKKKLDELINLIELRINNVLQPIINEYKKN